MSLLTTGQMIDRLKVGEEAECTNAPGSGGKTILINENGRLQFKDGFGFILTEFIRNKAQWRILPKYVSFKEATEAYKEGKTITCEFISVLEDKEICVHSFSESRSTYVGDLSFHMITNGKWTIKP